MKLKKGVNIQGLRQETFIGIIVSNDVYKKHGYELIITGGLDGKHSKTSLHYSGCAVDLRTRHIETENKKKEIRNQIKDALGDNFDVVLEKTHIHLEYQPRMP